MVAALLTGTVSPDHNDWFLKQSTKCAAIHTVFASSIMTAVFISCTVVLSTFLMMGSHDAANAPMLR